MKKKFTAAFLLVFFIAAFPVLLHAGGLTFSVGSVGTVQGDSVVMPINVSNNPGFVSTGLIVYYDPNALEITGVSSAVPEMPLSSQFELTASPGTQWISIINPSLTDWRGNGTLVNIHFRIRPNAVLGASNVTLAFTGVPDGTPGNAGGRIITDVATVSGHVFALQATPTPAPQPIPPAQQTPVPPLSTAPTPIPPAQQTPVPTVAPAPTQTAAPTPAPTQTSPPVSQATPSPTTAATAPAASAASPSPSPSPTTTAATPATPRPTTTPTATPGGQATPAPGAGATDAPNQTGGITTGTIVLIIVIVILAAGLIACVVYILKKQKSPGN